MEELVTQRFNEFRQSLGLSILALSKIINVGQATLNKQTKDDGCGVSISTIVKTLEAYPNLSAEWLIRGVGSMEHGCQAQAGDKYIQHLESEVEYLREQNMLLLRREKMAV